MQVWHALSEVPGDLGRTVVTIGNFDGVHRGHRHVLARSRELADEIGCDAVVAVTFDPHPMRVLLPERAPQTLTSVPHRVELLARAGADAALVLAFTTDLAHMSPEDFVAQVLLDGLHAGGIVVGENFRFGYRAQGDVALLSRMCDARRVQVVALPLDGVGEKTWSSTYIRTCLSEGDVEAAAEALGRPYAVIGEVVRGHQRGRQLGYPTANVPVRGSETAVPSDGVYSGWLRRLDQPDSAYLPAAISVGTNPTFGDSDRHVESYVLDRTDLELYGVRVEVSFVERLRGMVKFDSVDDLLVQMRHDVDTARAHLVTPPST